MIFNVLSSTMLILYQRMIEITMDALMLHAIYPLQSINFTTSKSQIGSLGRVGHVARVGHWAELVTWLELVIGLSWSRSLSWSLG